MLLPIAAFLPLVLLVFWLIRVRLVPRVQRLLRLAREDSEP